MSKVRVWTLYWRPEDAREAAQCWQPPADVYRSRTGWLLKFDLAGVRPEDVRVRIAGSRVTVDGMRRDTALEEGYRPYSMEIAYNRFERTIELPGDLSNAEYALEARDGLLLVRVNLER